MCTVLIFALLLRRNVASLPNCELSRGVVPDVVYRHLNSRCNV